MFYGKYQRGPIGSCLTGDVTLCRVHGSVGKWAQTETMTSAHWDILKHADKYVRKSVRRKHCLKIISNKYKLIYIADAVSQGGLFTKKWLINNYVNEGPIFPQTSGG